MKHFTLFTIGLLAGLFSLQGQGDSIPLPHSSIPEISWKGGEHNYYSQIWANQVVTNVSAPSLEVFIPEEGKGNGAAVIVAPGGGLYALSIESEGKQVASWLAERGYTAFVLKYRLVPTGSDGVQEITTLSVENPQMIMQEVGSVLPYSIQDGLNAVAHVRTQAAAYGIDPEKIGFMGFSAGGAVTMGVAYESKAANAPDFIVPVYPWTDAYAVKSAPETAPDMLIICASDDPLGLANGSVELYSAWLEAGAVAALHMYSRGGHGFGMKTQELPSDSWIHRFHDWSKVHILEGR
jgi:acetyl esterase/lipase